MTTRLRPREPEFLLELSFVTQLIADEGGPCVW